MNWQDLDKELNINELKEEVENVEEYESLADGKYEVSVNNLELGESKNGDPMVKICFQVVEGVENENRLAFANLVIQPSNTKALKYQLKNVVTMINGLRGIIGDENKLGNEMYLFNGFADLEKTIKNLAHEVEDYEYLIELKTNKGGYQSATVVDIYPLED